MSAFLQQILSVLQANQRPEVISTGDFTCDTHLDVVVRYVSVVLNSLLVSLLIAKEYIFDPGLVCETENYPLSTFTFARAHCLVASYKTVNGQKKMFLEHYFPLLLLIQVVSFSMPHMLWNLILGNRIRSYIYCMRSMLESLRKEWERLIYGARDATDSGSREMVKSTIELKFYNTAIERILHLIEKDHITFWYFFKHSLIVTISVGWILLLRVNPFFDSTGNSSYSCALPGEKYVTCVYPTAPLSLMTRYINEAFIYATILCSGYTIGITLSGKFAKTYGFIRHLRMNFFDQVVIKATADMDLKDSSDLLANRSLNIGILSQIMYCNENVLPFVMLKSLRRLYRPNVDDPSVLRSTNVSMIFSPELTRAADSVVVEKH